MGGSVSTGFDYDAQLFADTKAQSVEVKGDDKEKDCGLARRSARCPDKLVKYVDEDEKGNGIKTIWEIFQRGVSKFGKSNMLGARPFELKSTDEKEIAKLKEAAQKGGVEASAAPAKTDAKDTKDTKDTKGAAKDVAKGPSRDYGIKLNSDKTLARKGYAFMTYEQVDKEARDFGAGLAKLGAKPKDAVGIWSINRPEWVIAFLAFHSQTLKTVSLYATLGSDAVKYICDHADCEIVITEKNNLKTLLSVAPQLKKLKHVIQIDFNDRWGNLHEYVEEKDAKAFEAINVQLHGFSAVQKAGSEDKNAELHLPSGDDLAYIMYTSGTTGTPKGAMLTHANVTATIATVEYSLPLTEKDSHISYLPLAHIFECIVECALISHGSCIGFYSGVPAKITEDMSLLNPTILCGVPKVFTTFYQKVMGAINERGCLVQYMFYKNYNAAVELIRSGKKVDASTDAKYFAPIRAKMGLTKCRIFVTGAAPCRPYIMEFLRAISAGLDGQVLQGYGMTETAAASSLTSKGDVNMGHCGPPVPCCEIKLRDIPEMKYLHTDKMPRGEILVRGSNIFAGYFKNEVATKETIEPGGWLATGDVGRWNPNGTLSIIDRKKNLFKLSQGEYIAAEKVEGIYSKCQAVGQIWIYGNSTKSVVVAVVVPNCDALRVWAEGAGLWTVPREQIRGGTGYSDVALKAFDDLCTGAAAAKVKAWIFAEMGKLNNELNGLERCKDIIIESKMDERGFGFTEINDTLTPTNKLKRPMLLAKYLKVLKEVYAKLGEPTQPNEKWPGES